MSQKVSPFMGGLGIDATSKFEIQSNATVTVGDGTTTGNVVIGGKVGIGTTSPVYPLVVQDANPRLQLLASGTNVGTSGILFGDADTAVRGQINYTHSDDELSFIVNAQERMRIDASGNLGIGTDSPSTTLDVAGDVSLGTNSSNTITLTGSIDLGTL